VLLFLLGVTLRTSRKRLFNLTLTVSGAARQAKSAPIQVAKASAAIHPRIASIAVRPDHPPSHDREQLEPNVYHCTPLVNRRH